MEYLSQGQKDSIKGILKNVTDTFFKSDIVYHRDVGSLDRFNEDRVDEVFTDYNLLGMVQYTEKLTVGYARPSLQGSLVESDIEVTFNTQDLVAQELIVNNFPVFKTDRDYFHAHGLLYKIVFVGMDGPLDALPVLSFIHGKLQPQQT